MAEAVHCLTYCAAYSQFAEQERGRLLPGMLADLTVLSRDIFTADPADILGTTAELVMRSGEVIHGAI